MAKKIDEFEQPDSLPTYPTENFSFFQAEYSNVFKKGFAPTILSPISTGISLLQNRQVYKKDTYNNLGKLELGPVSLELTDFENKFKLNSSVAPLFHYIHALYTAQNDMHPLKKGEEPGPGNYTVSFTIQEYLETVGKSTDKNSVDVMRRKLKQQLDALHRSVFKFSDNKNYLQLSIIEGFAITNNVVSVALTRTLTSYLQRNKILTQLPQSYLTWEDRDNVERQIHYKLNRHYFIDRNIKRGTNNIISVKSLLEGVTDIPSYEEVKETDRAYTRRITDRLEEGLDKIAKRGIITWEYCNPGKAPLTITQLQNMDFNTISNLYIHFEILNAPDQSERIKAKEKKQKQADRRKKK